MNVRKLTAQVLTLSIFHLSLAGGPPRLRGDSAEAELQRRVEEFGEGAELKLQLKNGEKLRGTVENIGDDSFRYVLKEDGASREIAFDDVRKVHYPRRGYKAEGAPDPVAAKRMVVQLGVCEHIMVKISPTEKVRGHIVDIQDDHFVVLPDGQRSTVHVPYNSVWKVNKNLSFGATLAILTGIAAAVVLVLVLTGEDRIDVLPD